MQFFSFVVIVIFGLFAFSSSKRIRNDGYLCPDNVSEDECQNYKCPKNSELVECVNFCNTCENRTVCIDYCLPGCNCKEGFFRDTAGACVLKTQCPQIQPGMKGGKDDNCTRRCTRRCRSMNKGRGICIEGGCLCFLREENVPSGQDGGEVREEGDATRINCSQRCSRRCKRMGRSGGTCHAGRNCVCFGNGR